MVPKSTPPRDTEVIVLHNRRSRGLRGKLTGIHCRLPFTPKSTPSEITTSFESYKAPANCNLPSGWLQTTEHDQGM